ncbi:unannotated protein [freshwater metagenome]|uniref:Unannotated protein n=1 Tax=freshwater metagenome TaxID=449393 RepID=A0A6J7BJD7_9ZZZZ
MKFAVTSGLARKGTYDVAETLQSTLSLSGLISAAFSPFAFTFVRITWQVSGVDTVAVV